MSLGDFRSYFKVSIVVGQNWIMSSIVFQTEGAEQRKERSRTQLMLDEVASQGSSENNININICSIKLK